MIRLRVFARSSAAGAGRRPGRRSIASEGTNFACRCRQSFLDQVCSYVGLAWHGPGECSAGAGEQHLAARCRRLIALPLSTPRSRSTTGHRCPTRSSLGQSRGKGKLLLQQSSQTRPSCRPPPLSPTPPPRLRPRSCRARWCARRPESYLRRYLLLRSPLRALRPPSLPPSRPRRARRTPRMSSCCSGPSRAVSLTGACPCTTTRACSPGSGTASTVVSPGPASRLGLHSADR